MPTPIEIILDPVSISALLIYAGLIAWEALAPARPLPGVRGWVAKGLISFAAYFYLSTYLPLFWDQYLAPYQLLDLTGAGTAVGVVVGMLVVELGIYWWHRCMHKFDPLWRVFHQFHHSAERLDTFGAFWFSPMDMIGWTALGSLALVGVVGISPEATTIVLLATFFLTVFQHTNVHTPHWLGYIIQRPESHSIHHQRGVHYYNFSDFPFLDMLFGTLRNPATYSEFQDFYHGASSRILSMLTFHDVSEPRTAEATADASVGRITRST